MTTKSKWLIALMAVAIATSLFANESSKSDSPKTLLEKVDKQVTKAFSKKKKAKVQQAAKETFNEVQSDLKDEIQKANLSDAKKIALFELMDDVSQDLK